MADYLITMDTGEQFLAHHGVKGMKWGKWNSETAARYSGGNGERKGMSDSTKQKLKTAGKVAAIGIGTAAAIYGAQKGINKLGNSEITEKLLEKKYKTDELKKVSDKLTDQYLKTRTDKNFETMHKAFDNYTYARNTVDAKLNKMKTFGNSKGKLIALSGGVGAGAGYLIAKNGRKLNQRRLESTVKAQKRDADKMVEKYKKQTKPRINSREEYAVYANSPEYGKAVKKHIKLDSDGKMVFSKQLEQYAGVKGSEFDDYELAYLLANEYENNRKRER